MSKSGWRGLERQPVSPFYFYGCYPWLSHFFSFPFTVYHQGARSQMTVWKTRFVSSIDPPFYCLGKGRRLALGSDRAPGESAGGVMSLRTVLFSSRAFSSIVLPRRQPGDER